MEEKEKKTKIYKQWYIEQNNNKSRVFQKIIDIQPVNLLKSVYIYFKNTLIKIIKKIQEYKRLLS